MAPNIVPLIINGEDVVLGGEHDNTVFTANPDIPNHTSSSSSVQGATPQLCVKAVSSCAEAFPNWSKTRLSERKALFTRLAQVLRTKATGLSCVIQEELCCSKAWASINVEETIGLAEQMAALATSSALVATVPEIRARKAHGVVVKAPLGVILGIAPWNAPAILGLRAVAAPVLAGNCAILKGSELSPRTHYFLASAFREAGFPPGVVNFLVHRPEDAPTIFETLISQPDVRKCNFTGSTAVGRHIAMRAAFHLKPVLLELGGKNYAIVLDNADLEAASDMILEGAYLNSGQICMSTDMVLVSSRVKLDLCRILREKLQRFSSQHVTRLISAKSDARIAALCEDALAKGAQLHCAAIEPDSKSGRVNGDGCRSQCANIIENVTSDMRFWREESFGPLVGVTVCEGLDDAVSIVNSCRYGLSAAIFCKAGIEIMVQAQRLNVGAVHVNGSTVHDEPTLPHGGCKDSGWGRFGGHWALEEFVQTQTIIIN